MERNYVCTNISDTNIEEAKDGNLLNQGKIHDIKWLQFKPPKNSAIMLLLETKTSTQQLISEFELYKSRQDIKEISPFYMKIGKKNGNKVDPACNDPTQVEVLINTKCIPIRHYRDISLVKPEVLKVRMALIQNILREACNRLSKSNCIHGDISPDTLLYDEVDRVVIMRASHSILPISRVRLNKVYHVAKMTPYNSVQLNYEFDLTEAEAVAMDISSVLLSLFELGFMLPDTSACGCHSVEDTTFLTKVEKHGINIEQVNVDALFAHTHHIFNQKDIMSDASCEKLINLFKKYIVSPTNYSKILEELNKFYIEPVTGFTTIKAETISLFKTPVDGILKIKTLKERYQSSPIFYIELKNSERFILKKFGNQKKYKTEEQIFKAINELEKNKDKPLNGLIKLQKKIPIVEINLELAIEYNGGDLCSSTNQISPGALLKRVPEIFYTIATSLADANLFHCDIKPPNITISDTKACVIDYDNSQLVTDVQAKGLYNCIGLTPEFAAPEILKTFLKIEGCEEITPFLVDVYSLGKSLICTLHRKLRFLDILNSFYKPPELPDFKNEMEFSQYAKASKNMQSMNINYSMDSTYFMMYQYLYLRNDDFVKLANKPAQTEVLGVPMYQEILAFLISTVATKPQDRPSLSKIVDFYNNYKSKLQPTPTLTNSITINTQVKARTVEAPTVVKEPISTTYPMSNGDANSSQSISLSLDGAPDISQLKLPFYLPELDSSLQKVTFNEVALIQCANKEYALEGRHKSICKLDYPILSQMVYSFNVNKDELLLYFIGGLISLESHDPSNSVKLFNGASKAYQTLGNKLKHARYCFGVTSYKNQIAIAGGIGDVDDAINSNLNNPLNSLEIYERDSFECKSSIKLNEGKKDPVLIFNSSVIYVIGGTTYSGSTESNTTTSSLIEIYHISSQELQNVKIITELFTQIVSCPAFEVRSPSNNQILIFKEMLSKLPPNINPFESSFEITSQWLLTISETTANITLANPLLPKEGSSIYVDYSTCNVLNFANDSLIIPNGIIEPSNNANFASSPILLRYNHSTKMVSQIVMKS